MASVGIIGGGISGLSAAHYLSKLSATKVKKIILYEASDRLGGWIQTSQGDDGSLFESGPRSVRPIGAAAQTTLSLVEDVGLSDQVISIPRSHSAAKNRLIYANGQLHFLPNQLADLFKVKAPLTSRLFPRLLAEVFVGKSGEEDESVDSFFRRRLGDEVADYYVNSMCHGIFAGDSRKLSIRSCFKDIWSLEQRHGSLVGAAVSGIFSRAESPKNAQSVCALAKRAKSENWAVWSLKKGLEDLPRAIEQSLLRDDRIEIRKGTSVSAISFVNQSSVQVTAGGKSDDFRHVISSVYAGTLAQLLPTTIPSISAVLRKILAVNVAVINVEYDRLIFPLSAFGYLVPSSENSKILGVIFDSCLFNEHSQKRNSTRLTCMLGGAYFEKHFGKVNSIEDGALIAAALDSIAEHLKIRQKPTRIKMTLHKNCIPQYHVGHQADVAAVRKSIAEQNLPLSLIGSSYDGVSINDCVHGGKMVADKIKND